MSEIKSCQDQFLLRVSLLGSSMAISSFILTESSVHVRLCPSSSLYKDPSHSGLGPTLTSSLCLNHHSKNPILRYWGIGLQHMSFVGPQFSPGSSEPGSMALDSGSPHICPCPFSDIQCPFESDRKLLQGSGMSLLIWRANVPMGL